MTDRSIVDLRSDTITRPTAGMRAAMAEAPVGDDQYGEDPSVNRLQDRTAELLGKEAALWMPSGTMSNQVALRLLTRPGDNVIVSRESHIVWHEAGGGAANAGVQFTELGRTGRFSADEFRGARNPRDHALYPPTTLVALENTQNRMGGVVLPQTEVNEVCEAAREHGVATYLDGARLWNAAAASGRPLAELASPFDVVSVALSKGLGAPAGSLLAGSREDMTAAVRHRRMLGGAMRQVGILAAAGSYAIDHHLDRLGEDHRNARLIGERIATSSRIEIDLEALQTNIIVFRMHPEAPDAPSVVAAARDRGVLLFAFGPRTVRAVTHLDVTEGQCRRAAEVILELAGS